MLPGMLSYISIGTKLQTADQIEPSSHIFAFTRLQFVPREARTAFSLIFGSGMTVSRGYAPANSCFGFNSACRGSSPNACAALCQSCVTRCQHLSQLSSGVQRGQHRTNQLYMSKVHPFDLTLCKLSQLPITVGTCTDKFLSSCILRYKYLHISGKTLYNIFKYFSIIAPTGTPQKRFYCLNDPYWTHCTSLLIYLIQHMLLQVFALKSQVLHCRWNFFAFCWYFKSF
ncbi:hypothetical protein SS50377_21743 [Spironucleus salmonicida]|uniref:Uncharacterized protein n=1 Tax=Spironucleus salmonicida TaxID=348837 RepID=V6LGZ5_9EUKA|nr:hypothetical protein SS50377_21743 [Spironucleus salmonicida]|eukprot:EST42981.1 Hypothetical protein SS50377_17378 [Spironucleus salmonicida]